MVDLTNIALVDLKYCTGRLHKYCSGRPHHYCYVRPYKYCYVKSSQIKLNVLRINVTEKNFCRTGN